MKYFIFYSMVASILDNPEKLIDLIRENKKFSDSEIEEKIEEKIKEYGGLLTRAGAAYSIAKDMGVIVPKLNIPKIKINELTDRLNHVELEAEVVNVFPIHTFEREGKEGKVKNEIIKDDVGQIKLVIWGDKADIDINTGDMIEISNAYVKGSELHIGDRSSLELIERKESKEEMSKIIDLKNGDNNKSIRAFVVEAYTPKIIEICDSCGSMIKEGLCPKCGRTQTRKTAILNVELDDGSAVIRATFYRKLAEDFMGLNATELYVDQKLFDYKKTQLLGREKIFVGNVKENTYFKANDFIINSFDNVNLENEIERLST